MSPSKPHHTSENDLIRWLTGTVHQAYHQEHNATPESCPRDICVGVRHFFAERHRRADTAESSGPAEAVQVVTVSGCRETVRTLAEPFASRVRQVLSRCYQCQRLVHTYNATEGRAVCRVCTSGRLLQHDEVQTIKYALAEEEQARKARPAYVLHLSQEGILTGEEKERRLPVLPAFAERFLHLMPICVDCDSQCNTYNPATQEALCTHPGCESTTPLNPELVKKLHEVLREVNVAVTRQKPETAEPTPPEAPRGLPEGVPELRLPETLPGAMALTLEALMLTYVRAGKAHLPRMRLAGAEDILREYAREHALFADASAPGGAVPPEKERPAKTPNPTVRELFPKESK